MAELLLPKQIAWVRFPSPAQTQCLQQQQRFPARPNKLDSPNEKKPPEGGFLLSAQEIT